jgi:hypothetical protein
LQQDNKIITVFDGPYLGAHFELHLEVGMVAETEAQSNTGIGA